MNIPYLDLKIQNFFIKQELTKAFEEVLHSGWYILGEKVEQFEKEYSQFNKVNYCVGVGNGLDALILSLKSLNIGKGDEVIVPSNTYIATWLAVSSVGAIPIPVEPRIDTYNINPELIEEKITRNTKAIIPVNLYGQAAELQEVCNIADKYNLFVIEDNAQAQGAMYNGKLTGSWGIINATSFYPGKNLGALGDAGAITTHNEELYQKVRKLRNYGSEKKYYNEIKGVNSRLDELQAAFLLVKLKHINNANNERINLAKLYNTLLANIDEINLPKLNPGSTSVFHIYVIRTPKRNELQAYLAKKGIGTLIHYPVPPHLQKTYSELNYKLGDFPIAEQIANTCLSLPLYPGMSIDQIEYIADQIKLFFK